MICISTITSTATRAYAIAKKFHEQKIPVVIGGSHVTFLSEEGLKYADFVIRGEGEEAIVELIECLNRNSGETLYAIKGLSFHASADKIVHNSPRPLIKDLDSAPIPDFSLVANWEGKKNIIPVVTSRGCTFKCKFCSVIPMFGGKMRFKSVERVIEELKAALKYNPRHILFGDDNFTANKKRTKDICQAIIDNKLKIKWSAQVRTDVIDDLDLVDLMRKAGCISVFIGFESINPKTLEAYEKRQDLDKIRRCIAVLKEAFIKIHGMFVINPDMDDVQTIQDTVKFTKEMDLDSVQFLALTPFPGTPIFEEMERENRLLHRDWSRYDTHHIVFDPKKMKVEDLQIGLLKGMRSFYNWGYSLKWFMRACGSPLVGKFSLNGLFYAGIGVYGRRTTKKALKKAPDYFQYLLELETEACKKRLPEKISCSCN